MDKILAVDLCETIYKSNTTQDFFNYVFGQSLEYKKLKSKNSSFSFKVYNKISNKLLKVDKSRILLTKILKDKTKSEIEELVLNFIKDFLEPKKNIKVQEIIKEYQSKGYKVIIISASYDFIAKGVVKYLNLDSYIASEAEVLKDIYTGNVKSDLLYKKFEVFKNQFRDYDDLIMITDNITDYMFVKETKKSYIVINDRNKEFWLKRKESKFIFLED